MREQEIKLLSPMESLHKFAKTLTNKVRELDKMEREWKINTGQATEILEQLIEAHLYTVFKSMLNSNYSQQEQEAAYKAMTQLIKQDMLQPNPVQEKQE